MELGKVFVDSVIVGKRHRAIVPAMVDVLAESLKAIGLQQPISVYVDDKDAAFLVAGLHRLEAARKLGWEEIDATFVRMSEADRELWEIAENLHRTDLTKEERDKHIRRYAELLRDRASAKVAQSEPLSKPVTGRGNIGIARKIADETGLSKSTVQRALNPQPVIRKPVSPAEPALNEHEAFNKWCAEMNRTWGRAPLEWRDRWLQQIDIPVMDGAAA